MKRQAWLWLVILAAPVVWFASMCANFALAPWACSLQWKTALYAVSACALLITGIAGGAAWLEWRQLGREFPGETAGAAAVTRALASGGVLLSALFFLVILAQTIVELLLGACQ